MPRVYNRKHKHPPDAVNIMRPSKWGNPFVIGVHGDRKTVIRKYREWLPKQKHLMADLHELRGRDLLCCCDPLDCHGWILVELANREKRTIEEEEL